MVKVGTLKDYRNAQKLLQEAKLSITTHDGDLVKKTYVDGVEVVSIAKWQGSTWIFRYNPNYFKEAELNG